MNRLSLKEAVEIEKKSSPDAFFTGLAQDNSIEKLASIFSKSVIPLLQEYFYEDYQKIQLVLGDNGKSDELEAGQLECSFEEAAKKIAESGGGIKSLLVK